MSSVTPGRVLIVDDEPGICSMLAQLLSTFGYTTAMASSADEAIRVLEAQDIDVVLSDLRMGTEMAAGIRVLQTVRLRWPHTQVILLTAHADVHATIEAVNHRAFQFLVKPPETERLLAVVEQAIQERRTHVTLAALEPAQPQRLIGQAAAFRAAIEIARTAAATATTVLLEGETGTGKELFARLIHERSPRRSRPFKPINCGAIPASLLESLLFGHVKGAFTDAKEAAPGLLRAADGGTVFLDEIGEMPADLQVKLLRVLQDKEVLPVGATTPVPIDVRFIGATHRHLRDEVAQGRFREDVYYRLATIEITLPPLRERLEDIPLLVPELLRRIWTRLGRGGRVPVASQAMLAALGRYDWPGNIRQLEHVLERACVLGAGAGVSPEVIAQALGPERRPPRGAHVSESSAPAGGAPGALSVLPVDALPPLAVIEAAYCEFVLQRAGGAKGRAAQILQIDPGTLARKRKGAEESSGR